MRQREGGAGDTAEGEKSTQQEAGGEIQAGVLRNGNSRVHTEWLGLEAASGEDPLQTPA